ncbi:MAG TPA: MG2 domain-containing protein, partial [Chloroflexia bacterium]|nr:MG2 domain-containing protein [Chloroflexia bacterium]
QVRGDWSKYKGQPLALLDGGGDSAVVASWWNENIGPWNFDLSIKDRKYINGMAIYTDRAIYRPGQTVFFKGILRDDDDGHYSVPGEPVPVTLADINGRVIYSETLALSPFGSFAGQYTLPDYAPLGTYYLNCKCDVRYGGSGVTLEVQEYRKPEYLVGVTTDKPSYINGEQINATASADYFFGGPVAGAKVTTRVLTEDYYFTWADPNGGGWYDFQDLQQLLDRRDSFHGEKRSESQATSDAAGKVHLTLPADIGNDPLSQVQTIEAAVQDSANQEISSNTQVIIHKGQYYIGLRPTSYLDAAGQPMTIDVQTVAATGERKSQMAVTVQFYRRVWEQTTEKDETGLDRPTWKPKDTLLGQQQVTTDAQGHTQVSFTPQEAGQYRIAAQSRDAAGNTITSATYGYATDSTPGAAPVPWQQKNNNVVTLVADKSSYAPGDTAHILVTSPFTQATGLLTIERGHILSRQIVDLRGPAPVIDVPITDGYLPNVYLGLSMVAPAGGAGPMPDFRQGYLALPVSPASKQLAVTITPSSTEAHPRDTITYTVAVRDAAGRPAAAELSLALVDKAIFSLAGDQTPALMDSFYGVRPLDFSTASSLLVLGDQVATARTTGGKGGGGGGAGNFVRSQFSDTAYWKAQVTTDANGQAVVSVPLPDNLTTWRLTALAVTRDTQVGQATNEIVSTKPLLLRPRLPRFLMSGDRVAPAVIIENRSGCPFDADVSLTLAGADFAKDGPAATQRVRLDGEKLVSWQIIAGQSPTATLSFSVGGGTCNGQAVSGDSLQIQLPVKPLLTTEDVATSGEVEKNSTLTENVFLPHGVDPSQGELTLQVAPSLAAGAALAVDYVKDETFDSTEQIVSRFLPLLRLSKAYATANRTTPYSAEVPGLVNRAVAALYRGQHYDGGWGWYAESSSDPYLTAYALEGLAAAQAAGYNVSQAVLDNGANYLDGWLNAEPGDARDSNLRLDTRAYALYVLAATGHPNLSRARPLAVRENSLALYGRAYLALAFQRLGAPDDANRLLTNLAGAAKQTTTTAHWEESAARTPSAYLDMDTDARTTALVLQALLIRDKDDPLVPRGVRWLMENRRAGHWLSTQETAAVLSTLAAYMTASGELAGSGAWSVIINGQAWSAPAGPDGATELHKAISDLLINQDNAITITRPDNTGRLYYNLNLRYTRAGAQVTARNEGLSILREYVRPGSGDGKGSDPGAPLTSVAAGDLVEVRLTVIAPTDAYYLTAEDPLPAGLEAVNGTLRTTGLTERLDTRPPATGNGKDGEPRQAATASFFDNVEMRDDRTLLFASYLPAGVYEYRYLARATTPGDYSVLPANARLTYLPDVWGRSDSGHLTVTEAK